MSALATSALDEVSVSFPPTTSFTSALLWHSSGYVVLPFKLGTKGKGARKGWENLRLTANQLPARFGPECNIGILLGTNNNNSDLYPADADIDCPEALLLAPAHLHNTPVGWGRASKLGSHRLYSLDRPIPSLEFKDPISNAMLVELRCVKRDGTPGKQTIVPYSLHESGEYIQFNPEVVFPLAPLKITADALVNDISRLAAAALLARYWPGRGQRNPFELNLAGVLARAGWEMDSAHEFIRNTYEAAKIMAGEQATADELARVKNSVAATYKNFENDKEITGIPKLKEIIDPKVVEKVLEWLGIKGEAKESKESFREEFYAIVLDNLEVFKNHTDQTFVAYPVDARVEIASITSNRFADYLMYRAHELGHVLIDADVDRSIAYLTGKTFDKRVRDVFVRVGHKDGKLYLDLCDKEWRCIEIDAQGYRVLSRSPVAFVRDGAMQPLPVPEPGGNLADLFQFVNAHDVESRVMSIVWLIGCFLQAGTFPILGLTGEEGSAKSSFCRYLRSVVDPSSTPLLAFPRDEREMNITMSNMFIGCYDNISSISEWVSNVLCKVASGTAQRVKENYADRSEIHFNNRNPLMLNGIANFIDKSDLLDRSLCLHLEPLINRDEEANLDKAFAALHPKLLGSLLKVISYGLGHACDTEIPAGIRLADFTLFVLRCEPALKDLDLGIGEEGDEQTWQPGTFLEIYQDNRNSAQGSSLEDDPFASAFLKQALKDTQNVGCVDASATEMMKLFTKPADLHEDIRLPQSKRWPSSPVWFSRRVVQLGRMLRAENIDVRIIKTKKGRFIRLTRVEKQMVLVPDHVREYMEKDAA